MSTAVRTQAQAAPTRSFTPAPKVVLQPKCTCGGEPGPTGKCPPCDEHEQRKLQRFAAGPSAPSAVPPIVHDVLQSPGQPLDAGTRSFMEPRFGHDFSQVRVHTDGHAAESARAVNALAYTVGRDIAFDHGQYRPYTHSGKQLLAHELAHTIQQGGVQRYAKDVQMGVAADTRLERDAEAAARAVTAQADGLAPPVLPIATRVFHPTIARAPAGPEDPNEEVREWEPAPSELKAIGVTAQSKHTPGVVSGIRAFRIKELPLPPEKGDVLEAWKARAAVGGLEAIVDVEGNPSAALKQERPATDTLRSIWLTKVGWDKKKAAENWKAAGGDSANFDPPKAGGGVCEMDHIVELQFLGSNAKENIQALDKSENASSGATIRGFLAGKASEIRNKVSGLKQVILHFDNVTQTSAICKACCKVEQAALAGSKGQAAAAADVEPYPVSAGGTATNLLVPKGTSQKKQTATIDIYESTIPQNRSAATLIPGLLLSTLNRKPPGSDIIEAKIDTRSKTALPITITDKKDKVPLRVAEGTGELKLVDPKPHMKFTYPYLSAGAITKLSYDPAGLSGEGTLTPSIPLLKDMQFGVAFSPNDFRITAGLDPQKIKPPIPGAKVKKAELAIVLVPEFNPSGTIEFEFAPGGRSCSTLHWSFKGIRAVSLR